jgi:hypothetical protein
MISAERLRELIDVCDAYAAEHPHENDEQIAQCMRELEAVRSRIAELEQMNGDLHLAIADHAKCVFQGLSQEDREACLIGANVLDGRCSDEARKGCWDERAHALWQRCAAILRRLGGQTT